ncbi:Acyl-CoA-binding protein 1 [Tolypocladium paradoxum]|uniref:Acyl-CoA-binding protein 1 n=1 Tax=Tolypocladium paradoxum TaxID=94208 RepID=A0A2S4L1I4_9HYPO|nr:Acyl-CoA-binding protein 1 [Tolypocladium paradoxum]
MSAPQSEAFKKAVADSKKLTSKPSSDDLLALYDFHRRGHCQGARPGHAKAKKNAWQKVVDEGVTPEQAQEKYVALVETMKETYGYDENKVPEAVGN